MGKMADLPVQAMEAEDEEEALAKTLANQRMQRIQMTNGRRKATFAQDIGGFRARILQALSPEYLEGE